MRFVLILKQTPFLRKINIDKYMNISIMMYDTINLITSLDVITEISLSPFHLKMPCRI